jgi:hypothetical protein
MKVSEKQLIMLMDILKDTLKISNVLGGYDLPTRLQLTDDLINQQSNDLKEVEPINYKDELDKRLHVVNTDEVAKRGKTVLKG